MHRILFLPLVACLACGPSRNTEQKVEDKAPAAPGTYAHDAEFLRKHTQNVIELADESREAKILLSADYQGRVMTSTAKGDSGVSFGWINYDLIAAAEKKAQFNPVGGEERFWLGPEGGQYALYFKKGDPFTLPHWQVPAVIDTEAYAVSLSSPTQASFTSKATLTNYQGTEFRVGIARNIALLDRNMIGERLNAALSDSIAVVGYETENKIQNLGDAPWQKQTGLLSIWLLGMMTPSPETMVIIPFHPGPDSRAGITDDYFGAIPPGRLVVSDSVLYFRCDGKHRSKIGLSPRVAKPMAASYDFRNNVLTLIHFSVTADAPYVNSTWKNQEHPYAGDVVNAYNDGPQPDGSQLGPFYELESSSVAAELAKGETLTYKQMTCHLQGDYKLMRALARRVLGIDLDNLNN
ncbi:DUF6786 family protein [Chryseolinea lacunae]|uniref:Lipoprotein n=1 Tax=Chryseolinea lacunae TaxID=2801331 RepID=A0ABS1KXX7_9BACT|nr:DUF6786 family protein [Chryseolinea lacunae]MBL0743181.1 hypothetical protein [Chryseolinea lacunae]